MFLGMGLDCTDFCPRPSATSLSGAEALICAHWREGYSRWVSQVALLDREYPCSLEHGSSPVSCPGILVILLNYMAGPRLCSLSHGPCLCSCAMYRSTGRALSVFEGQSAEAVPWIHTAFSVLLKLNSGA